MALLRASPILLAPALMALACLLWVRRRRRAAAAIGERRLVARAAGDDLHAVPWTRVVTMLTTALALGLAATIPRGGVAEEGAHDGGRDIVLVLDASNSMLVGDVRPSRLQLQRQAAQRIVRVLPSDRIGVVVFAGQASVLSPPTRDHDAVAMYIDAVAPEIAVQTGSALAAGIRQATSLLAAAERRGGAPAMVLISDGESPDGERNAAPAAARRAADLGITVHTLGTGTERGGPVPDLDPGTGRAGGYKVDPFTGETAYSALDVEALRDIAREGGGSYHDLRGTDALDDLLARLHGTTTAGPGDPGGGRASRSAWFVALALVLIAADAVRERRRA